MNEIKYVRHSQIERGENPRKFFNPVSGAKLRASIREHGVRRNLEVIELTGQEATVNGQEGEGGAGWQPVSRYRLVTGERRWMETGALLEDLPTEGGTPILDDLVKLRQAREMMPVMILSEADAAKAIELALVENSQRDDITALEEADAYAGMLLRLNPATGENYTIKEIADKVSEEPSLVKRRLRLRKAPDFYLEAVNEGLVAATCAELIGTLPDAKAREAVAKWALKPGDAEFPLNYVQLKDYIHREVMLSIKGAPFDAKDAELVPVTTVDGVTFGGRCAECELLSGNNTEMKAEFSVGRTDGGRGRTPGASPDLCCRPSCWRAKVEATKEKIKARALAKGQGFIDGEDAKKIFGGYLGTLSDYSYAAPTDHPDHRDIGKYDYNSKHPAWRELAKKVGVPATIVWNPFKNEAVELYDRKEVAKVTMEKAGKKKCLFTKPKARSSGGRGYKAPTEAERKAEEEKRAREGRIEHRLIARFMDLLKERLQGGVPEEVLEDLLNEIFCMANECGRTGDLFGYFVGKPQEGGWLSRDSVWKAFEAKRKAQKGNWMGWVGVLAALSSVGHSKLVESDLVKALSKHWKIDLKKMQAEAAAEEPVAEVKSEEVGKGKGKKGKLKTVSKSAAVTRNVAAVHAEETGAVARVKSEEACVTLEDEGSLSKRPAKKKKKGSKADRLAAVLKTPATTDKAAKKK